ncbi:thiol:disulfide interchange protein DsbA/DsbL [Sansalvadorimonas sp. 2012CJ34-2]|uniref:Thiol:disulfide interchange protein n=1 Tax=Parendozoicomonas callyspongiae TaxID=2942213 RepID=A0ABT0PAP8_9GAMM|nr:thiol:disulfide interchange protein DsbA/DsbL [Sansalvadorimonas sp. 2012CJ34-2]MCL6268467.1 thiol:disulfide interchange protein DsbA/DsbL [Sansalvadorimonas sp. 2012CJ34-2]
MHKLWHIFFIFLALWALSGIATAASFKEGVDYKLLKQPLPLSQTDKIEVNTIFWYGCPHCFDLAKMQVNWKKRQPSDVLTVETPVIFGRPWQAHAQLFYALEEMGLQERTLFKLFDAVQNQGKRLDNEKDMQVFLKEHFDVKPEEFDKVFDSFGVRNQVQKASAATRGAQLMGVPAIIVSGRYLIDPQMAGGLENMLNITDFLIEKIRKEKGSGGKSADKKAG